MNSGAFTIDSRTGSGVLSGMVIGLNAQGQSQGPLTGATVSIPAVGSATTNSQGAFSFGTVPEGTYAVTAGKSGYLSVSRAVTLRAAETRNETFQLTIQSASGAPVTSGFSSPNGKHFIEGMPGNLTFSTDVAWNGSAGSVRFSIAGTWYPATVQDLGGGMARATLTVAAPATLGACTELTIEVTNGESKKVYVNTGVHFSPIPGIIIPWYRDNIPWTPSSFTYSFSQTLELLPFMPLGNLNIGPLEIEPFGAIKQDLSYDLLAARFRGGRVDQWGVRFKVGHNAPGLFCPVHVYGELRGSRTGGLEIQYAGCHPPTQLPYWRQGISGKFGVGVPTVCFVEPVIPPAAVAIHFLLGIPVVCDVVGALETRFYILLGFDYVGCYPNGELGDDPVLLLAKTVEGTATFGLEIQSVLELWGASVGLYAGGTVSAAPAIPVENAKVRGYAGVFAKYLLFQYKQEYGVEFSFDDSGNKGKAPPGVVSRPGNMYWEPINEGLLAWGEAHRAAFSLVEPDRSLAGRSAAESGGSFEFLAVENVAQSAKPSLIINSLESMVLFTLHDPLKPTYAATDIGIARSDNNTAWSVSRIVDDQQAEFNASVTPVNINEALATWQRISGDISGATAPEQLLSHLDIVAAHLDRLTGVWSVPAQLTNNDVLDRDPVPVVFGSIQGIIWIQNEADASPGNATRGDRLMFAPYTGGTWEPAQTLWTGQKGILECAFVADGGGEGHIVLTVDEDGDNETKTDRELYEIATVGGHWQPPVRLTNDAAEDSLPVLVAPNGASLLVWSVDGTLRYTSLATWNPRDVYSEYTVANQAPSLAGVTLPGGAAIAYTVQGSEGVDIVAGFYDANLDQWSLPRQLTQDEHAETSLSLAWDGSELVMAYLKTQTERNNVDVEIDGVVYHLTNVPQPARTDLYVLRHALGNDLAVAADSITVDPPNPPPGSAVMLKATVENRGDLAVSDALVAFYDGDPDAGGSLIATTQVPDLLIGGATRELTVAWDVPPSASSHELYVVADLLDDRDRSNNVASTWSVLPDVAFETGWYNEVSTTSLALTARIINPGSVPTGAIAVSWRLDTADGPQIGTSTVNSIVAGGACEVAYVWNTQGLPPGEFVQVAAVADLANAIFESDEANNVQLMAVRIPAPPVPPPAITAALSRKTHGSAGTFDLDVKSATAVECRVDGPTTLVVTCDQPVQQVTGTTGDVSVSSGTVTSLALNGNELTITMSGAADAALLTVGFPGIRSTAGQIMADTLCVGTLKGDVNADRTVNVLDLVTIRNQLNSAVDANNFRTDVNADGAINILDLVTVRNNLNKTVESCPQ